MAQDEELLLDKLRAITSRDHDHASFVGTTGTAKPLSARKIVNSKNLTLKKECKSLFIIILLVYSCTTEHSTDANSWVFVEGGSFLMGCIDSPTRTCPLDEKPQHLRLVTDFYISKFEVTVQEYMNFCDSTNREVPSFKPDWGWRNNHPMVSITYEDAKSFATWKNARLPTEIEWEYAARGGQMSKGFQFSGSNDLNEVGWNSRNSKKMTHPVGRKVPNELGIYDMSGNVLEWCESNFFQYDSSVYNRFPTHKVIRGGSSWGYNNCTTTMRGLAIDDLYNTFLGFRIAKSKSVSEVGTQN